ANWLATNGALWAGWTTAPGGGDISLVASGDGWPRVQLLNNSYINFGPGTAGTDTNLYRSGVNQLKTDGSLTVAGYIVANSASAATLIALWNDGKIYFNNAFDTNLYRSAAGILKTDGEFDAGSAIFANKGLAWQMALGGGGS